jgi:geranylgeranylglycerol-phosphate geranylgeranyltransferase
MTFTGTGPIAQRLAYVRELCRPWALTVTVGLVALVQIAVSGGAPRWGYILLSSLAIACVVLGGFALNDYVDRDLDRAAHPDRLIPTGRMKPRAMLGFALATFSAALAFFLMLDVTALIIGMLLVLLLVVYTPLKNRYGPLGNVTISAIAALAVVYGVVTGKPSALHASLLLLAGGVFFALLSQESVKDIEDMDGERDFRRTIPLIWGPTTAFRLAALFLAIATFLLVGSSLLQNGLLGVGLTMPVVVYAMALGWLLFNATRDRATLVVRLLKVGFTATLALLILVY